jgi:ribosome-associated protein
MDIQNIASFADFFILCNGTSDRQIEALAEAVQEIGKKEFGIISQIEGQAIDGWLLVDLGDTIVHLFSPDQREYYGLEDLWEHGKVLLRLQ